MKHLLQTKLRLIFSLVVLLTILFSLQLIVVKAQDAGFEAGLAGQAANATSNAIGTYMLANSVLAKMGAAKIKSGKATTAFVHSPDIYRHMLSFTTWDADEPQTELGRIKYLQGQVNRFEARMAKAGYRLHDNAEAGTFACMLSYQAQYDKAQLTPAQLEVFRQIRQGSHQADLNSVDYQGITDLQKETIYIWDAMMSIQAIEWRESTCGKDKCRAPRSGGKRQTLCCSENGAFQRRRTAQTSATSREIA